MSLPGRPRTDCGRYDRARLLRPSWIELDWSAMRANVRRARALVGPGVRIWFVCKGDGFGFGATAAARVAADEGVDGFCAGSPEEVVALHEAGTGLPVILFASTLPEHLADAAALGAIVTLQSPENVAAAVASGRPMEVMVEIDTGLGRFGLNERQWPTALARLAGAPHVRVRGLYGHLSSPDDPAVSAEQADRYRRAVRDAEAAGHRGFEQMLASSRVMLDYPELSFTAVDPGRLIYGALDAPWMEKGGLRPTLKAVKSRIIQVQRHPPGTVLGIGYGAPIVLTAEMRTAVAPIGFWDGLGHFPPLGSVLVGGVRCPVLGRRTFQHSVIDVSGAPGAAVGDEVVLMGEQAGGRITIDELAAATGTGPIELTPRLLRSLPHVYVG